MLSLSALDTFLSISETELIEDMLIVLLATPQLALFFEKFPHLKHSISRDIPLWREQLQARLQDERIPHELAKEVLCYQQIQRLDGPEFNTHLPEILRQLSEINSPFTEQAHQLHANNAHFTPALQTLFLQRWRLSLIVQSTTINQQIMKEERERLLAELLKRLALTGQLAPILGTNDDATSKLWDMSTTDVQPGDAHLLLQYAGVLEHQPELLALAQQLGRSAQARSQPHESGTMETRRTIVREPATVPEQVDGIQHSDDILRLLPAELATLGISELELDFYRRLVEKQLLTYRLHGDNWREKITEHPVVHEDNDIQPRGPFVVCVDTSGSMGGFNEQCARAFCLALMRIALEDNRRCFIMLFSSEVISYELTAQDGIEQAIRFLSQQFRGGTDIASCLRAICERFQMTGWQDADAVIISDFIAQRLPDDLINLTHSLQRHHQHRFHALAFSSHGKPGIMRIFDHIWRFDTGLRSRLQRRWQR